MPSWSPAISQLASLKDQAGLNLQILLAAQVEMETCRTDWETLFPSIITVTFRGQDLQP